MTSATNPHLRSLGNQGEREVAAYLQHKSLRIIDRNWRIKGGEIDLVVESPSKKIHFVEVKTRSTSAFGHPLEAIDREKAYRLQKLALAWLVSHESFGADYQVDVAAVTLSKSLRPTIDYRSGIL